MSMIEKVARAMCDGKWGAKDFNETANGESPEEQREYWMDKARVAIEAMQEPTEAMEKAGEDAIYDIEPYIAGKAYDAMIAAALTPPE